MYTLLSVFLLSVCLLIGRLFYLLTNLRHRKLSAHNRKTSKTMIVIGSGGHTTEMLRMIDKLNKKLFTPRIYVVANTDDKSIHKILDQDKSSESSIVKIPRSRKVHQSYFTSVFTTLYSILYSTSCMFAHRPDVILCNGPGTCIPICVIAFIMRLLFLSNNCIIFTESLCRVKTLSLTGKILYYFADQIIVHSKELQDKYKRSIFIGDNIK